MIVTQNIMKTLHVSGCVYEYSKYGGKYYKRKINEKE